MTTLSEEEEVCCVCGTISTHMAIGSTNVFGSPDLDTRPPEMKRSTIHYWIQRCSSCGYCSSDISECDGNIKDIVGSEEYQGITKGSGIPKVAASFLASSFLYKKQGQYMDAAWSAIHAAWICDDENNYEGSKECRIEAISMIEKAEERSEKLADQAGASEAITIDLMRRAGIFDKALALVEETKEKDVEEILTMVILFEEKLLLSEDIDAHTVADALGE